MSHAAYETLYWGICVYESYQKHTWYVTGQLLMINQTSRWIVSPQCHHFILFSYLNIFTRYYWQTSGKVWFYLKELPLKKKKNIKPSHCEIFLWTGRDPGRRNGLRWKWIKEIHPVGVIKHTDPEVVKKERKKKTAGDGEHQWRDKRDDRQQQKEDVRKNITEDQRPNLTAEHFLNH